MSISWLFPYSLACLFLVLTKLVNKIILYKSLGSVNSELLLIIGVTFLSNVKLQKSSVNVTDLVEQEIGVSSVKDGCTIRALGIFSKD